MKTKTIIERSTHPNVTPKSLMTGRANGLLLLLLVMRFAMAPGWAQTYSVLHSFTGDDGSEPNGPLILSGDTLYGSTFLGGGPPGFVGGGTTSGAVAAGLCGKGPAVTAVVPEDKVDSVRAALQKFGGEILMANLNCEKARVL